MLMTFSLYMNSYVTYLLLILKTFPGSMTPWSCHGGSWRDFTLAASITGLSRETAAGPRSLEKSPEGGLLLGGR